MKINKAGNGGQYKSLGKSTRFGLALFSEEFDGALVLRDYYGQVGADSLHLIQKPGFSEVGIDDMDKQSVFFSDDGLELGRDVHAVGPDGDEHDVFVKVDSQFLEQRILAGRGRVGLADRPLGNLAHECIVLSLSLDDSFGRIGGLFTESGANVDASLEGCDYWCLCSGLSFGLQGHPSEAPPVPSWWHDGQWLVPCRGLNHY